MVEVTVTVESHGLDTLGSSTLGSELTYQSSYFTLVLAGSLCYNLLRRCC